MASDRKGVDCRIATSERGDLHGVQFAGEDLLLRSKLGVAVGLIDVTDGQQPFCDFPSIARS